jgi:hypothetical protein
MSQGKHKVGAAARSRRRTPDREVGAKSAVDNRNHATWGKARPHAGEPVAEKPAPCPQSYLQWAAFAAGTQDGDFGFGAYFVDASSAPPTRYTWTPSRRR